MQYSYKLENLRCKSCASLLARNLSSIDYIISADVNFDTKIVKFETNRNLTNEEINLVINTIYSLSLCNSHKQGTKLIEEFTFDNVDCPNCALKIENALKKNINIIDAKINFFSKKIIITHLDNVEVFDSIQEIGRTVEDDFTLYKMQSNDLDLEKKPEEKQTLEKKSSFNLNYHKIFLVIGLLLFVASLIFKFASKNNSFKIAYVITSFLSYGFLGYKIIIKSIKMFFKGKIFNENFLMLLASFIAMLINEQIEAIMLIILYSIGEKLEKKAIDKSYESINKMMNYTVDQVTLLNGTKISVSDVKIGDEYQVLAGGKIPIDGIIIEGSTDIDTKNITGESLPKTYHEGETVMSGCINLTKVIKIKATVTESDSTISKVTKLIENATLSKTKTEKFIEKFARIYTPLVLLFALLIFLIQYFALEFSLNSSLNNAFVFLVVSCPCALVISVPLAYFVGIGNLSGKGIMVKGSSYLEAVNNCDTVLFDKTGTLTKGNFKIKSCKTINFDEQTLLKLLATIESYSNHPIAHSIIDYYANKIDYKILSSVTELPGLGMKATYDDQILLVGKKEIMSNNGIIFEEIIEEGTVLYVSLDHKLIGYITIVDEVKKESKEVVKTLQKLGKKSIMLTGDNYFVSQRVAENLEIDEFYAMLLPSQKIEIINKLKKEGKKVLFIGDGINDSPSLKLADCGVAIGTSASDITTSTADIVIMNDEITNLLVIFKKAKFIRKIVLQNIIVALGIKFVVLILGAIGVFGTLGMLLGILADVGVMLIAIINSLRIKK